MKNRFNRALWTIFKGVCYASLVLLAIGLSLSVIGHLTACRANDKNIYPEYCVYAGVGAFIIFIYYITLIPVILAISGGTLIFLDIVRYGRRAMIKRSLPPIAE